MPPCAYSIGGRRGIRFAGRPDQTPGAGGVRHGHHGRDRGLHGGQRGAARHPRRPRRRLRRPAVDGQRLPGHAGLADPGRRLARRHLRRAADLHARGRRLRRHVGPVRAGAHDRGAGARPRAPGGGGRAAHSGGAGGDRGGVPRGRARQGGWRLDGLGSDRHGARAARGRPDRGRGVVAVDLRDQRAAGAGHAAAGRHAWSRRAERAAEGTQVDVAGGVALRAGLAGGHVRADPPARGRVRRPHGGRAPRGRPGTASWPSSCTSAAARIRCSTLELFKRRNFAVGNIETLSMYAGLSLLFFFLVLFLQNAAGYSAMPGRAGQPAGHDRHVPRVHALRRPGRPLRAALLHGRGPDRRRRWDGAADPARGRPRLRDRPAAAAADLRAWACR